MRQPRASLSLAAHQYEVLTADWCKYNDCIIATGSVDKSIKVGGERWVEGTKADWLPLRVAQAPMRGVYLSFKPINFG